MEPAGERYLEDHQAELVEPIPPPEPDSLPAVMERAIDLGQEIEKAKQNHRVPPHPGDRPLRHIDMTEAQSEQWNKSTPVSGPAGNDVRPTEKPVAAPLKPGIVGDITMNIYSATVDFLPKPDIFPLKDALHRGFSLLDMVFIPEISKAVFIFGKIEGDK